MNQLDEAETAFQSGMSNAEHEYQISEALKAADLAKTASASAGNEKEISKSSIYHDGHDLRGAFALNYALTSVIKGILSMANDQLDECADRLWRADALAAEADDWIVGVAYKFLPAISTAKRNATTRSESPAQICSCKPLPAFSDSRCLLKV